MKDVSQAKPNMLCKKFLKKNLCVIFAISEWTKPSAVSLVPKHAQHSLHCITPPNLVENGCRAPQNYQTSTTRLALAPLCTCTEKEPVDMFE